jgi:hypothetical protein
LIDILKCKNGDEEISKLEDEIKLLKNQNNQIKDKILTSSNNAKSKFHIRKVKDKNGTGLFSCFNKSDEEGYTITFNKNKNK